LQEKVQDGYEELLDPFRERWVTKHEKGDSPMNLIDELFVMKLAHRDLERKFGGVEVYVAWSQKAKDVVDRVGTRVDDESKGNWTLWKCGLEVQRVISNKFTKVTLRNVYVAITELPSRSIDGIQHAVETQAVIASIRQSVQ
jgi:hypothetical protein